MVPARGHVKFINNLDGKCKRHYRCSGGPGPAGFQDFVKSAGENVEPFGIRAGMKSELFETLEVEKRAICELRWRHILERRKDGFDSAGMLSLPAVEHFLHGLTLKIFLRSAEVAGNQGKIPYLCVAVDIALTAIGQGANHNVCLVIAEELGRHGLEGPAKKKV